MEKYLVVLPIDSEYNFINNDAEGLFKHIVEKLGEKNVINPKDPYFFKEGNTAFLSSRKPAIAAKELPLHQIGEYSLIISGHGNYKYILSSNINNESEAIKNLAKAIKKLNKDSSCTCMEVMFDSCYSAMEIKSVIPNISYISDDNECTPRKLSQKLKDTPCTGYISMINGNKAILSNNKNRSFDKKDAMVTFYNGIPIKSINNNLREKDKEHRALISPNLSSAERKNLKPYVKNWLLRVNSFIEEETRSKK